METNKRIQFIINPFSGIGKKKEVERLALEILAPSFELTFSYTEYAKHGIELSKQAVLDSYDYIIAVGGDGSVNEIGSQLINTDSTFGIIPAGSGNGLARTLQIPLQLKKAIECIKNQNIKTIDSGIIGKEIFLGTSGTGFDAHISSLFEKRKLRGPLPYFYLIIKEYFRFKENFYQLRLDNRNDFSENAWLISFCNSSQWGNNALISPNSSLQDNVLNCAILKRPNLLQIPLLIYQLVNGTIHNSKLYQNLEFKKMKLDSPLSEYHKDGETFNASGEINIEVLPNSLKVICL